MAHQNISLNPSDVRALISGGGSQSETSDPEGGCSLAALLAAIAQGPNERRRLAKVNPDWLNISLKSDSESKASRFLKATAKRKQARKGVLEARAAVPNEERIHIAKALERTALRMSNNLQRPPTTNPPTEAISSPNNSEDMVATSQKTERDYQLVNTTKYHVLGSNRSSEALKRWSHLGALKRVKSRAARRVASAHNCTVATKRSMRPAVRAVAAALKAMRDLFVDRLIGQKLPSAGVLARASIQKPLATRIGQSLLPLVGATVTFKPLQSARRRSASLKKKASAKGGALRTGVVIHETAKKAIVAMVRHNNATRREGDETTPPANSFSGLVESIRKTRLRRVT